jgi:predicted metal-binding transcription factor (methanogenesis marker protein 9)
MANIDQDKLRDLPGWEKDAPVPVCMNGDYRALTFCCKPGFSLTFGFKCQRDEKLKEIGIGIRLCVFRFNRLLLHEIRRMSSQGRCFG